MVYKFNKINRIELACSLVPPFNEKRGKGRWLDASSGRISEVQIKTAKEKNYDLTVIGTVTNKDEKVQYSDLRIYDKDLGKFDIITSTDTLEHIDDYMMALKNLKRYSNGYIIFSTPITFDRDDHVKLIPSKRNHNHEWLFSYKKLEKEIEELFEIRWRCLSPNPDKSPIKSKFFFILK